MGFFSWECAVSGDDIMNEYSDVGATPCVLVCPDDSLIEENKYNGYGIFGGADAYALLAQWNDPDLADDPVLSMTIDEAERLREIGIKIFFAQGKARPEYPLKFVLKEHYTGQTYNELKASGDAEGQGFWTSEGKREVMNMLSGGE